MIFRSKRALNQLLKHGIVATMRAYRYKPNARIIISTPSKRIGKGIVKAVVPNDGRNRSKYLKISGFPTVRDWLDEAFKLHNYIPPYIVVVKLVEVNKV